MLNDERGERGEGAECAECGKPVGENPVVVTDDFVVCRPCHDHTEQCWDATKVMLKEEGIKMPCDWLARRSAAASVRGEGDAKYRLMLICDTCSGYFEEWHESECTKCGHRYVPTPENQDCPECGHEGYDEMCPKCDNGHLLYADEDERFMAGYNAALAHARAPRPSDGEARNAYISTIPYDGKFDARVEGFNAGWYARAPRPGEDDVKATIRRDLTNAYNDVAAMSEAIKDAMVSTDSSFEYGQYIWNAALDRAADALTQQRWQTEWPADVDKVYLVTDKDGNVYAKSFYGTVGDVDFWHRNIVAWMPLPRPYRRGDEGGSE